LAARAQYPVKLAKRGRDVGHGAQHAGDDDRVELPGGRGKLRRGTLGHPDRHRNGRGRALGPAAQVGLGLHGHDLQHGHRIMREVQAGPRPDLHHPPGQPRQQLTSELAAAALLQAGTAPLEVTREQRVLHELHASIGTIGLPVTAGNLGTGSLDIPGRAGAVSRCG
jgi:hypothetical protein